MTKVGKGPVLPKVPVSVGELLDKISILEIKLEQISNEEKLRDIRQELSFLVATLDSLNLPSEVLVLATKLKGVNQSLWVVEDDLRGLEKAGVFDNVFVALARTVYRLNDKRFELKSQVNKLSGSHVVEQKSYEEY